MNCIFCIAIRKKSADASTGRTVLTGGWRWLSPAAVVLAALASAAPAHAAYICTVTANDLAFGNYSVIYPTVVDTSATIDMGCVENSYSNVRVTITISISTGSSGTFSPRSMLNGASALSYNIYRNAARTAIWGDGSGGSVTATSRCNLRNAITNCTVSRTMYGRIPAGQKLPAGGYLDTLIVTISY